VSLQGFTPKAGNNLGTIAAEYGRKSAVSAGVKARRTNKMRFHGKSAKPPFVGSNPTRASSFLTFQISELQLPPLSRPPQLGNIWEQLEKERLPDCRLHAANDEIRRQVLRFRDEGDFNVVVNDSFI
jgi:hypothetical protein